MKRFFFVFLFLCSSPCFSNEISLAAGTNPNPKIRMEDLGFKKTDFQKSPELQYEREKRSSMLKMHQTLAFVTWGLMAATVIMSGNVHSNNVHQYLGIATSASYFTTAYFSMFAPDPDRISGNNGLNIKIHKALRWVHLPLMLVLPFAAAQAQSQIRHGGEANHGLGKYKGAIGTGVFLSYSLAGSAMLFEF